MDDEDTLIHLETFFTPNIYHDIQTMLLNTNVFIGL